MTLAAWVIFTVFVVVFALSHESRQMRLLAKPIWILLILFLPFVGGILYLTNGRPIVKETKEPGQVAPDDNPEFLAELEEKLRKQNDDDASN